MDKVERSTRLDDWRMNWENTHGTILSRYIEKHWLNWLEVYQNYAVLAYEKPKMRWHYGKTWPKEKTVRWQFWGGPKGLECGEAGKGPFRNGSWEI